MLCGAEGVTVVPPRSGRAATMALLRRVEKTERALEGAGAVPLADALRRVRLIARRRGLVVVVTDLLDTGPWERELRGLAARHDVVVAHVVDRRELELPDVGLLTLVDPETGRRLEVQTASEKLRAKFAAAAAERHAAVQRAVLVSGASLLELSTDRDWLLDVVRFVARRRRRR
jgi:uncharacterized protein (DUF58 family)